MTIPTPPDPLWLLRCDVDLRVLQVVWPPGPKPDPTDFPSLRAWLHPGGHDKLAHMLDRVLRLGAAVGWQFLAPGEPGPGVLDLSAVLTAGQIWVAMGPDMSAVASLLLRLSTTADPALEAALNPLLAAIGAKPPQQHGERAVSEQRLIGGLLDIHAELVNRLRDVERENARLRRTVDAGFAAASGDSPGVPGRDSGATLLDGRYRLEAEIGSGGLCIVYRGTQRSVGRAVAVKVMNPQDTLHRSAGRHRLQMEGLALGRICHPSVVTLIDSHIGRHGEAWLVLELLQGQPLSGVLSHLRGLGLGRSLRVAQAVAAALAESHACGVIHRDVKPDNVFLHQTATEQIVKLIDFGSAYVAPSQVGVGSSPQDVGGMSIQWGTPEYVAPECLTGHWVDGRCDVYSLAIVLFQMLTGSVPFPYLGGDVQGVIMEQLHREPPRLADLDIVVPPALECALRAALHKNPDHRPTAQAFASALNDIARDLAARAPTAQ